LARRFASPWISQEKIFGPEWQAGRLLASDVVGLRSIDILIGYQCVTVDTDELLVTIRAV
jgi:hypothetical protein